MRKTAATIALILMGAFVANAQRRATVSGVVADAETKQSLIGALVGMSPTADSSKVTHIVSGAGGVFSTGLAQGGYNFEVSLLGYETLRRKVDVAAARVPVDTLYLSRGIVIDAVVKEAVALRTSMEGDTLIYNADSYKVAADADVSGLLQKMPGIKVEGGTVEAQGETVKKVLIDGREFFGEDVNAAITALPAEAVKSIEVFDKLSDNAEFTGIDDGEGYKAINITTRESMRQGIMGQVSALYGVEPPDKTDDSWHHYVLTSGNVSIFQGDAKITIGGTLNNLNERHFTTDDILGMGDNDDGLGKVARLQLNYIDVLGKKDQWNIDGSYSYNISDESDRTIIDREYFETDNAKYRDYYSDTRRSTLNNNHMFRGRIDFKPNQYHELRIRPYVSYQGNDSSREGNSIFYPIDGNAGDIDLRNWSNGDNTGMSTGLNINYRVRLGKPGRTLSLFFNGGYNYSDRLGESYSEEQDGTLRQQYIPAYNYGYNLMGGLTYTEPVSSSSLVNLDYSINYNYSDQNRKSYLYDFSDEEYYTTPDNKLSGIYNSGYLTQKVGPGYRMQKDKTTLSAGVFYQYSTLDGTRELPVTSHPDTHADFNNVTYSLMVNSTFKNKSSLRVFLNSMTRNPSVDNLQDVVDISSLQNIRKGNPGLRPSYNNMLYTRFILPNVEKGRTLSFNLGGSYAINSIANRTISNSPGYEIKDSEGNFVEDLDTVGRFSEPVNMDGDWSARFGVDYGFPLNFIKSNLNLNANVSYRESPSQMGKWLVTNPDNDGDGVADVVWTSNYSRVLSTGGGLTLGSNISEKIDFRVSYNISHNNVHNTFSDKSNSAYLRHRLNADMKFVLPLGFTISGNASYYNYNALSGGDFSQRYLIANAGIGKKVLRSQRGEVSLFVSDIFNQNIDFERSARAEYIQNQISTTIGRYFGIKFTWNIRKFGRNGSQNPSMYQHDDGHRHYDGHGGMPGGGFRGF